MELTTGKATGEQFIGGEVLLIGHNGMLLLINRISKEGLDLSQVDLRDCDNT